MPLSKSHKQATRLKIIEAAGTLFRKNGYEGVGVARIMAEAGLTKGGFYAHFWSKASLFREVLRSGEGLAAELRNREAGVSSRSVLREYLSPEKLEKSRTDCTLAALGGDVARTDAITRQAYTKVFRNLLSELEQDPGLKNDRQILLTAVLAIGGVTLAGALSDKKLAADMLEVCRAEIDSTLP